MNPSQIVLQKVNQILLRRGGQPVTTTKESLVLSGRFDSLAIVEMTVFLEDTFACEISSSDFEKSAFENVECILRLAGQKVEN